MMYVDCKSTGLRCSETLGITPRKAKLSHKDNNTTHYTTQQLKTQSKAKHQGRNQHKLEANNIKHSQYPSLSNKHYQV